MAQLGCLLLILSLVLGVGGIIAVVATDVAIPILEPLFCEENDTLIRTTRPTYEGESINYYCVDDDGGAQTSVDGKLFLVVLGLLAPLPLGIILMVAGSVRQTKRTVQDNLQRYGVPITSGGVTVQSYTTSSGDLSDFDEMLGPLMEKAKRVNVNNQMTLKEKLSQLQDAYDAGLIDRAEFDARKDQIL